MSDKQFIQQAISLATKNVKVGGRPFGAVIVKNGQVIAHAVNQITATNDPTAHAELLALREAGKVLGRAKLDDCVVYASGQPCPMCLAAMRMAGISQIFYAYSNHNLPNAAGILFNTLISQYKPPKAKNVAPLAISLLNDE
ncbi:TPA: nucleoside deaminase [Proteus mirabilis]